MDTRKRIISIMMATLVILLALTVGAWRLALPFAQAEPAASEAEAFATLPSAPEQAAADEAAAADTLILSYAAKFVCTESLQPGQTWYGAAAPIVQQKTGVLVHNPNGIPVQFYKKAVLAPVEKADQIEQGTLPGKWHPVVLLPDYAFQIDCDDIAKLLTGNPTATFIGTYGIGVTIEGFVVIGVGQQLVPGSNIKRLPALDVTSEYVRGSEVLKKDIHYQPWWWWWWWQLPWRLGYAYQRLLPMAATGTNIDCRGALYDALNRDVVVNIPHPALQQLTLQALENGHLLDPTNVLVRATAKSAPALVAMIGRCEPLDQGMLNVSYVLVSNKGPSDPDPRGPGQVETVAYPWIPGRWYDLALVTPQNFDIDLNQHLHTWQSQRWLTAGAPNDVVSTAMAYYFPYWCGWGYWWWWWNAGDCTDIGVGEGESLDVEQIAPVRVLMRQWPPAP